MGTEGPEFDVPAHIYRLSHDDAERTKLLKDVLRSTAKLQEEHGKKKRSNPRKVGFTSAQAPPPVVRGDASMRKAASAVSLTELAACQESDERFAAALAVVGEGGEQPSQLLKSCGQRISGLTEKLRLSDKQLKIAAAEAKAAEACGDTAPEHEIRIMDRPEEAPGIARARNDRVVYDFVAKHAHFTRLEEFKDKVDQSSNYDALRKIFPERFKHHPNMTLMDDTVLWDPTKLREAMWNRPLPVVGGGKGGLGVGSGEGKRRLESRMAVGLKANPASTCTLATRRAARTLRLDHSAPALL